MPPVHTPAERPEGAGEAVEVRRVAARVFYSGWSSKALIEQIADLEESVRERYAAIGRRDRMIERLEATLAPPPEASASLAEVEGLLSTLVDNAGKALDHYASEDEWDGKPWKLQFESTDLDADGYVVARDALARMVDDRAAALAALSRLADRHRAAPRAVAVPAELVRLSEAATPGPWSIFCEGLMRGVMALGRCVVGHVDRTESDPWEHDAALIAAAVNRLRDEIAASPSPDGAARDAGAPLVIAISGALGSGKASLGDALAEHIGADRVSFGKEVRKIAAEAGVDEPNAIHMLQLVGQSTVVNDCPGFVGRVLAQRDPASRRPLVIVGVRHVEVLCELRRRFDVPVRLVHVASSEASREKRIMDREHVERRVVARFDSDLTEVQNNRILPQYASATIDGSWPAELQVKRVVDLLGLQAPSPSTGSAGRADGEVAS